MYRVRTKRDGDDERIAVSMKVKRISALLLSVPCVVSTKGNVQSFESDLRFHRLREKGNEELACRDAIDIQQNTDKTY